MILSVVISGILGCGSYAFGTEVLKVYTEDPKVIQCGLEILSMTTVTYFLCGIMDLFPGALRGMGRSGVPMILSIIGTVGTRIVWIFMLFPQHRSLEFLIYFLSGILVIYNRNASNMLLFCTKTGACKRTGENDAGSTGKIDIKYK